MTIADDPVICSIASYRSRHSIDLDKASTAKYWPDNSVKTFDCLAAVERTAADCGEDRGADGAERRAKEALDAIPALLDRYRQSVLAAAFRGDLTADWRSRYPDTEPASELLEHIRASVESHSSNGDLMHPTRESGSGQPCR